MRILAGGGRAGVGAMGILIAVVRLGEHQGWLAGWARGYLDDVLFVPLVLTAALVGHRAAGAGPRWILPVWHGLAVVALTGLVFEWGLPRLFGRGVADPADLLAYLAGWVLFTLIVNRPARTVPGRGRPDPDSRECPWTPSKPSRPDVRSRSSIPITG